MLSKEEIEKAKDDLKNLYEMLNPKPSTSTNAIKTLLQYIEQLESRVQAQEMEHKYDVNMIDEVKGEAVQLYNKIDKLNKIIDEMANLLSSLKLSKDIEGYEIMEKEDWKQYFEKKVEGK